MFKIIPVNDKALQRRYAEECSAVYQEDYFAYAMLDAESGALMAISQFEIDEAGGYIADIKPKVGYRDFEAMFILGRATMNFIDTCDAHFCRAAIDAADERLLRAIGFRESENGELVCDMTGIFDGHCDGNAVKLD